MKESLHTPLKILVGIGLLAYALYLGLQGDYIALIQNNPTMNLVSYFLVFFISLCLILTNFNVITHFKKNRKFFKWDQMLFGILTILIANYFFSDNPSRYIYVRDILNLIGLTITILAPLGYLYTQKQQQQHFEQSVEIIEV